MEELNNEASALVEKVEPEAHECVTRLMENLTRTSREMNHDYIGTEHIVLGILNEDRGLAARMLVKRGLTIAETTAEVRKLLG